MCLCSIYTFLSCTLWHQINEGILIRGLVFLSKMHNLGGLIIVGGSMLNR